ncbi:GntT protein [Campylobacter sputorum subsp. bubulus]|uniref:GntT protein n=1 Tax=Campylobacter sputorum subsp. sputorum TaxID=32024 RepID=A0A381DJZ9_9BACT|nr:gluconate:H+ symporter [Campylobacter sputorum]ASM34299.1 putative gluconate permease, GntP family [Campylobacter sputorum aubsp. sputorum RM3237]KAB0582308.1 permease DsdX [Campylobacter sputorum subsp. sputorum]QEL04490.1 putative gluconate permease, GntP family [Campylobacter sputorum subsp. sputorum]SUX09264.1 GntT protein [Campylobacter sputorum subsp. bubulus]SUX10955.1 GntT protein [Campylobacter sputorum subsp. sputorum]
MSDFGLILTLIVAILLIVFMISKLKIHAFLTLSLASVFVAIVTGVKLDIITASLEKGIGSTLGFLAIIIGCGTILGKMLEISGGARVIADFLLNKLGKQRVNLVMVLVGFIAGIPVFVEVGFVLLVPLVLVVAKELKINPATIGISLATSLMTVHCIVPPHPAATAIVSTLKADMGMVIMLGLFTGLICAFVGGVVFMKFVKLPLNADIKLVKTDDIKDMPSFGISLFTILLPLILMLSKTIFLPLVEQSSSLSMIIKFIGDPIIALLISVFVAYYTLGIKRNLNMDNIFDITSSSFSPIAGVLLIIGAGGAFNEILVISGIGEALKNTLSTLPISPIFLAWLIALILHLAIGSATVAMLSAAGIVLPLLGSSTISPEIMCIAVGSGAIGATIVTDSLFWLVKEYLGISVSQMLRYFTTATTIASITGLAVSFILSFVF